MLGPLTTTAAVIQAAHLWQGGTPSQDAHAQTHGHGRTTPGAFTAEEFRRTKDMVRRFSDSYPQREFRYRFLFPGGDALEAGEADEASAAERGNSGSGSGAAAVEERQRSESAGAAEDEERIQRSREMKETMLKDVYSRVSHSVQDLIDNIDRDFGEKNRVQERKAGHREFRFHDDED